MPNNMHAAHTLVSKREPLSSQEQQRRKHRVLSHGTPSITGSIDDAVVTKNENLLFLTTPNGNVPLDANHGFGLYYHDCRYLNGYELRLANSKASVLVSDASRGYEAVFELTNPEIQVREGEHIHKEQIGIQWQRVVDGPNLRLVEVIRFQNYGMEEINFPVSLAFRAEFEDIFAVRGLLPEQPGERVPPHWDKGVLSFAYHGADRVDRGLTVNLVPAPDVTDGTTAHLALNLKPRESKQIAVSIAVSESPAAEDGQPKAKREAAVQRVRSGAVQKMDEWLGGGTEIRTSSMLLNNVLERSTRDLRMLRMHIGDQEFFAAGVPWFATLFGRDSLVTALQNLSFNPEIAAQTLRVLASYQGQRVDGWRDEEPGKILHELRVGEFARLGEIPHTPYYGSVDATPLFLILFGRHAAWTGSLALFDELRPNVEQALEWIDQYGDTDGDGYVDYECKSQSGLVNQGWKDSFDAIVNADGSIADPPVALVEVQGYVYLAKHSIADLFERAGEADRARSLRKEAEELCIRFNRDFWLDDLEYFALARQKGGKRAAVLSSNPGQALWTGIAEQDKAEKTAARLMSGDLFSGWGIRTLGQQETRYNPIGYHLGTVWPHDNSLIAAGLKRHGFDEEACRLFTGLVGAAMRFDGYRLPELFAGFPSDMYSVPVHYPVACRPQAWCAGAIPFMIESLLGLTPEAFERRLRIVRPVLPDFIDRLDVKRLRVGEASVDLVFERGEDHACKVQVLQVEGNLDVVVEPSKPTAAEG